MFATELNDELITIIRPTGEWDDAQCLGTAQGGVPVVLEQIPDITMAKAICTGCRLMEACLEGALERREPWGVWGGELFANGKILAQKRKRGRPPKVRPMTEGIALTA